MYHTINAKLPTGDRKAGRGFLCGVYLVENIFVMSADFAFPISSITNKTLANTILQRAAANTRKAGIKDIRRLGAASGG